jgi:hypothetical protein
MKETNEYGHRFFKSRVANPPKLRDVTNEWEQNDIGVVCEKATQ